MQLFALIFSYLAVVTVSTQEAERAAAAILGAYVADAATMSLHWIYEPDDIRDRLERAQTEDPAFFDPPSSPDYGAHTQYQYAVGDSSPYGDEALPLLRHLALHDGLDPAKFARESAEFMQAYSGRRNSIMERFIRKELGGIPWPDSAVKDRQAHSLIKLPALCARYAGLPELEERVTEAVQVHQDDAIAVSAGVAAAQILQRVILGETVESALRWAAKEIQDKDTRAMINRAICMKKGADGENMPLNCGVSLERVAEALGSDCMLPNSLQVALNAAASGTDFATAVRNNIVAAGDQCSRSMLLGALLAAEQGEEAIPREWLARMEPGRLAEIRSLSATIVRKRWGAGHDVDEL